MGMEASALASTYSSRRALGKCRGVQDHRPSSEPRGETGGAQKTRSRSFPRTFETPHLKDDAVRTAKSKSKSWSIKLVGIALALLLIVIHLAIFVWEEVKLPGSTGSLL